MNKGKNGLTAKQHIANVIRNLREKNGYTQKDIGNITGKAHTTVASWESAKSQPDVDTLLQLCLMYDVDDVLAEFEYRDRMNGITEPEQNFVKSYRGLSHKSKEIVLRIISDLTALEESFQEETYLAVARGNGSPVEVEKGDLDQLIPRSWNEK